MKTAELLVETVFFTEMTGLNPQELTVHNYFQNNLVHSFLIFLAICSFRFSPFIFNFWRLPRPILQDLGRKKLCLNHALNKVEHQKCYTKKSHSSIIRVSERRALHTVKIQPRANKTVVFFFFLSFFLSFFQLTVLGNRLWYIFYNWQLVIFVECVRFNVNYVEKEMQLITNNKILIKVLMHCLHVLPPEKGMKG